MEALRVWRCYLEGKHFTLCTDHQPLLYYNQLSKLSRRQARWAAYLSRFHFTWQHIPGKSNPADPLSRYPGFEPDDLHDAHHIGSLDHYDDEQYDDMLEPEPTAIAFTTMTTTVQPPDPACTHAPDQKRLKNRTERQLERWQVRSRITDEQLARIQKKCEEMPTLNTDVTPESIMDTLENDIQQELQIHKDIDTIIASDIALPPPPDIPPAHPTHEHRDNTLQTPHATAQASDEHHDTRTFEPGELQREHEPQAQLLPEGQKPDHEFVPPNHQAQHNDDTSDLETANPFYIRILIGYTRDPHFRKQANIDKYNQSTSGLFFETNKDELGITRAQIVVPNDPSLIKDIISECHDTPYSGHRGAKGTLKVIRRSYTWPNMTSHVEDYVKSCHTCQTCKPTNQKMAGLLKPLRIPNRKWASISIDLITDLPKTKRGHTAILTIVDRFSKMAHFVPCNKKCTAYDVACMIRDHVYRYHGLPDSILSDRDPRSIWHITFH